MTLGILKENEQEKRVAILPDEVIALKKMNVANILVEDGAGESAFVSNNIYKEAGADILTRSQVISQSDIIIGINPAPITDMVLESADSVGDVTVVVGEIPDAPTDALRGAVDWVRNKTEASAVLLASGIDGKVTLIAGMSKSVVAKGVKAGDLIKEIAPTVGGKGGGRPDMAQGGGNLPEKIGDALQSAREWLNQRLR